MTTRLVTSCGDCPFGYYDTSAGGSMCAAIESGGGYTPETGRPDWCPLSAGPVTVKIPTSDGIVRGSPAWMWRGRMKNACDGCQHIRACQNTNQCLGAHGTEVELCTDDEDPK